MPRIPPTIDWDTAILNLRVGSGKALFRPDAGTLREKSVFFAEILAEGWDESLTSWLDFVEPREFKIYKDWIYGREPRWFERYRHSSREGSRSACRPGRPWARNPRGESKRLEEPLLPSSMSPLDPRALFRRGLSIGDDESLERTSQTGLPRLWWHPQRCAIYQLMEFSKNVLPDGYMSEVYQTKLAIEELGRREELECLGATYKRMHRKLVDQA